MYSIAKFCYICMKTSHYVKSFNSLDKDCLTILDCSFSTVSLETSSMYICTKCSHKLQQTCDFLKQCQTSSKLLKNYIHRLQQNDSSSGKSAQLFVAMVDFKKCDKNVNIIDQSDYPVQKVTNFEIKTEGNTCNESDTEVFIENAVQNNCTPEFAGVLPEYVEIKSEYCSNINNNEVSINGTSELAASHVSTNSKDIEMLIKTETENSCSSEVNPVHNEVIDESVSEEIDSTWGETFSVEPQSELDVKIGLISSHTGLIYARPDRPISKECLPVFSNDFGTSEMPPSEECIAQLSNNIGSTEIRASEKCIPELSANINSPLETRLQEFDFNKILQTGLEKNNAECDPPTKQKIEHKCTKCLKVFTSRRNLINHKESVKCTELNFKCVICNMAFRFRAHLLKHLQQHTDRKPYKCGTCHKEFARRRNMEKHTQKFHARLLNCPICNETLKGEVALQKHMHLHRDDRPYSCPLCSKRYVRHVHLVRHLESHDLKP